MPFFSAAILASIIAERTTGTGLAKAAIGSNSSATDLMTFISVWFALRTCYVVSYVLIGDHKKSFIRSAFYSAASIWCINQFWKCAKVLG